MSQIFGSENVNTLLLIIYVLSALILSFLCSVAEAVLLSITPSYIENQSGRRPRFASLLKCLRQDNIDQALAAILTLNTIAHTVGALGAGAKATIVFGHAWFGIFSALLTLMILFLSEIVPKTIGAVYWTRLVGFTVYFVNGLIILLYPIVRISEGLTRFISRGQAVHLFKRDELLAMSRIGEQAGKISKDEVRIIRNLLHFGFLKATDIMTPRIVIGSLPDDITVSTALQYVEKMPFSRLPIYHEDLDNITGYVLRDELLLANAKGREDETLTNLRHDMLVVPELISLTNLLEQFLEHRQHIAVVIDEHGGTAGLVTLEDLVETLMGMEIMDETDEVADMRTLAREKWTERAKKLGFDSQLWETESGRPS